MKRLTSVAELDFRPRGPVFPSPTDWRDQVVYQLMIDRFDDGRDHPAFDPATATPRQSNIEEGRKFQGGTLQGIIRRLDYIQGLGATAVWISPPLKNRQADPQTYHGYGAQDFLAIDPRFGTTEDLRALADALHARSMYLVMDIVVDHAGDVWAYQNDEQPVYNKGRKFPFGWWRSADGAGPMKGQEPGPDDAVWPVELQRPEAFLRQGRMGHISDTTGLELTDGDFLDLKCFDLSKPEVMDAMIAIFKYWIAVADIDGFRIDAARHIRPADLQTFSNAIRDYARRIGKANFAQVGELAHGGEETRRFIASNAPLAHEHEEAEHPFLDATLDFDLFKTAAQVFLGKLPPAALRQRWEFLEAYHRDPSMATKYYWSFVENHDMGASGTRRLLAGIPDEHATAYALRAMTFLLCGPGVPVLYYGTEQGFNGDGTSEPCCIEGEFHEASPGDHCIREALFGGTWGGKQSQGAHFFNPNHPIYQGIRKLSDLRAKVPALRYGRTIPRDAGPGVICFGRQLDTQQLTIALNLTDKPWHGHVEAPASCGCERVHSLWTGRPFEQTHQGIQLTLPPYGFDILINDR